jgi:hypothetical protein
MLLERHRIESSPATRHRSRYAGNLLRDPDCRLVSNVRVRDGDRLVIDDS